MKKLKVKQNIKNDLKHITKFAFVMLLFVFSFATIKNVFAGTKDVSLKITFMNSYNTEQGSVFYTLDDGENWVEVTANFDDTVAVTGNNLRLRIVPKSGYQVDSTATSYLEGDDEVNRKSLNVEENAPIFGGLTGNNGYYVDSSATKVELSNVEFNEDGGGNHGYNYADATGINFILSDNPMTCADESDPSCFLGKLTYDLCDNNTCVGGGEVFKEEKEDLSAEDLALLDHIILKLTVPNGYHLDFFSVNMVDTEKHVSNVNLDGEARDNLVSTNGYYLDLTTVENLNAVVVEVRLENNVSTNNVMTFKDATISEGSALFTVDTTTVTASLYNGENKVNIASDGKANFSKERYADNADRVLNTIKLTNFNRETMDIWVYCPQNNQFNEKLGTNENSPVTLSNNIISISSNRWIPENLNFIIVPKGEVPDDLNDTIEVSFRNATVNTGNKSITYTLEENVNVVVSLPSNIDNLEFSSNQAPDGQGGTVNNARLEADRSVIKNIIFQLSDNYNTSTMIVSTDMSGNRGVLSVDNTNKTFTFNGVVLTDNVDVQIEYASNSMAFNGEAYFVWACKDTNTICYHKFTNISGRSVLTDKQGKVVKDDNGEPYAYYAINYFDVNDVTDQSGNNLDFITVASSLSENLLANWVLAVDVEDNQGNFIGTRSTIFGNGYEDMGLQLDPTGAPSGDNSVGSNGDRNFRAVIYNPTGYESIVFDANPASYTYYPSFWDQVFFTNTFDISGTSADSPIEFNTYLLEPNIKFTTGEHSLSTIISVSALNVNSNAVSISKDGDEFTITFNSNYYDKIVFELTAQNGNKYYVQINRTIGFASGNSNNEHGTTKAYFELYYPIAYNENSFQVVATIEYKDGSIETRILNADTKMTNYFDNSIINASKVSGGKNLYYSQYSIDYNLSTMKKISYTVINSGALSGESYGGTLSGSGKGVVFEPSR